MSGIRWLETDTLTNQDISADLQIGSYIADAVRLIIVQILIDQVVGNGDYIFYAKLQIGGVGSAYRFIPITTANATVGVTAVGSQSIGILVMTGDVLTVFAKGLAGDIATPDIVVRFAETSALQSTDIVEGTLTILQALKLIASALFGKSSGGGTPTVKFRDTQDSIDRIVGTIDANGNRTNVTLDGS